MVVGFVIVIFIPALLMLFGVRSERLQAEEDVSVPAPSGTAWLDGTFQQDFDTWFTMRYPGRTRMIQSYTAWESTEAAAAYHLLDPMRKAVQNDQGTASDTAAGQDNHGSPQSVIGQLAEAKKSYASPVFPEYAVTVPPAAEQSPFRGTDDDIVGKDGVLLPTVYINEVLGFSPRYTSITDDQITKKVQQLAYIQQQLKDRNIAFTVVITPNKAAYYADYIPDWYLDQHTMPKDYVRPYTRFLAKLNSEGVNHVDTGTVFAQNGLSNSFPMTGVHWNAISSVPVAQAVMEEGARQLGVDTRGIQTTGIKAVEGRIDNEEFGLEQDLFESIYANRSAEIEKAIIDPYYYFPETETVNSEAKPLDGVWIQGGSFRYDIEKHLMNSGYEETLISSNYNDMEFERDGKPITNWEDLLSSVSYVVFEVNEQFVYNMGGSRFWEIDENTNPQDIGDFNIYDALEAYLRNGDNSAF